MRMYASHKFLKSRVRLVALRGLWFHVTQMFMFMLSYYHKQRLCLALAYIHISEYTT